MFQPPRIAVRALILKDQRLLLVNAYPGGRSDLWCAPGGGVEAHRSLPDNLVREVREETGLTVTVGAPVLVNEFHDPESGFHQIEMFFRCFTADSMPERWTDPEGVVTKRRFFSRSELRNVRYRPDSLPLAAWDDRPHILYDPLELRVR